jgi:hypothetical protein
MSFGIGFEEEDPMMSSWEGELDAGLSLKVWQSALQRVIFF